jgi:type I restriction enzyme M protein
MVAKKYNQTDLNNILWEAADSSRTSVDAGIYKDYALTMLFFKYISDKSKKQHAEYAERYGADEGRIASKMKQDRFYLPPNTDFDYIYAKKEEDNIGEEINKVLHWIEETNKAKLEGVFSVDFNSESILGKQAQRNKMLRHLIDDFYKIDLRDADEDIIGNSYMYLIERFGADAGKKAGEFFTVKSVAKLVAMLAQPKPGDRIA